MKTARLNASPDKIVGIILAGGKAQRLDNVDKAELRVGGIKLITRVAKTLRPQCHDLYLSRGAIERTLNDKHAQISVIADPGLGPARALLAAASHVRSDNELGGDEQNTDDHVWLLTAAVDSPFFPEDFCERAMALVAPGIDAVVAHYAHQAYPTNALWRLSALLKLMATFSDTKRSLALRGLLDQIKWAKMDYADTVGLNPFLNVNTRSDLIACNRAMLD